MEENPHSFLIAEHIAQALKQTSREATILLYSPARDPLLQKITEQVDRVFCIYSEQAKGQKAEAKMAGAQRTLRTWEFCLHTLARYDLLFGKFAEFIDSRLH